MRPRTAFIWGTFGARLAMICQSVVGTCHLGAEGVERETQIVRHLDPKCLGALPTASGGITRLAYARGREAGIELGPLLKKSGLTAREIEDGKARLEVKRQIEFLNLVADAVGDEFLGFRLAQLPDLRELGFLYYVAASSQTLGDVLRRTARYSSTVNEGLSVKYLEGKTFRAVFEYVGVARHPDRHQMEFFTVVLMRVCRQLTGRRLAPSRVRLTHHRDRDCSELSAFFGCEVEFGGAADDIIFDAAIADTPVVSADPYLNELLIAVCEEGLARRRTDRGSFRANVENAVAPLLPHGNARADEVARRLGLSERTFARRLASEGLTFSKVLEGLRSDLARQYLEDPGLSMSKIAWLLGYREASAFNHAFKRWTGKTPRQVRLPQSAMI